MVTAQMTLAAAWLRERPSGWLSQAGEPPVITAIEPPSLLTLTILGRVLERSIGSSAWITRHGPNRLTSIASATVPRSALLAVAPRPYMLDALLTRTSVRPNLPFTHSAI